MGSRAQILPLEKEMSWVEVNLPFDDAAEEASNVKGLVPWSDTKPMKPDSRCLPDAPGGLGRRTRHQREPRPLPLALYGRQPEAFLPLKLLRWKTDKKQHISLN